MVSTNLIHFPGHHIPRIPYPPIFFKLNPAKTMSYLSLDSSLRRREIEDAIKVDVTVRIHAYNTVRFLYWQREGFETRPDLSTNEP